MESLNTPTMRFIISKLFRVLLILLTFAAAIMLTGLIISIKNGHLMYPSLVYVLLFPAGLLEMIPKFIQKIIFPKEVAGAGPWSGWLSPIGWLFYFGISLSFVLMRTRLKAILFYLILIVLLATNLVGCLKLFDM